MSINYHAYQSRGYLFENFEVQCEQWRNLYTGFDPVRVAGILNLTYNCDYVYVSYYRQAYRLCLSDGVLEKQTGDEWTDQLYFNETMSVYHLLHYVKDNPGVSGIWIPNENLDARRRSKINDILLESFSAKFSGKCDELTKACKAIHGTVCEKGDVSFEFEVFPQVKIRMVFWDRDEDFPAQTQIFVDSQITDFVHVETTGCMVSDLLEKLETIKY